MLASTALLAGETVVVGGSGKPSVSVDYGVLDELGQLPVVPSLLIPGQGPARSGRIELRMPGTPQAETTPKVTPAPAIPESIVLTPEAAAEPKALPSPPVLAPKAMAPEAAAEPKALPSPPVLAPKAMAPEGKKPTLDMPDAPPPPITLTEPLTALPSEPKPQLEEVDKQTAQPTGKASMEKTAKLLPASTPIELGDPISVEFESKSALLSNEAKTELNGLIKRLKGNPGIRIQLLAYASGTPETASKARHLSLSRALVVRSYLIEAGVSSIRIDVRALGSQSKDEPADRVDLVFADGESKKL